MGGEHLGTDLLVTPFFSGHTWITVDLQEGGGDLQTAQGVHGLRQALVLRLLTERGDLAQLGHAHYGSRLHELIGEPLDDRNRQRARAFILEALAQDKRVAKVLSLELQPPDPSAPHTLRFQLHVEAIGPGAVVGLGIEVNL